MSRGILYCAIGKKYVDEAIVSATSSLRHNNVPHVVYTDCEPLPTVAGIEFRAYRSCGEPKADRMAIMGATPFTETIQLDTDTYVVDDITGLFGLLSRFDLAVAHAPGYLGLTDSEVPEAFYEVNTGVIVYRKSPAVMQFLANWRATYLGWMEDPRFRKWAVLGDQPSLRRCLWASDASIYIIGPEYNYRTIVPGRLVGRVKIIHGRVIDHEALAEHLNEGRGPRNFPAFI